jgi:ATP-dependent RNA helicase RhlE
VKSDTRFEHLKLDSRLIGRLSQNGLEFATPIQARLIPMLLNDANVIASAKTGSGKTLAFLLPVIDRLLANPTKYHYPKVFVLAPTKELASQLYKVAWEYTKSLGVEVAILQGGSNRQKERERLKKGVDIVIATPQRANEHIEARDLDIKSIKTFIVDEADMAFDMGFVGYIEKILAKISPKSQKVIVSATITPRVVKLAKSYIKPIRKVEIDATNKVADTVTHYLYPVLRSKKNELLSWLISHNNYDRVLVFVRKKEIADSLEERLKEWDYKVGVLHGQKLHNERRKALNDFKNGKLRVLIATDIVARGLDIEGLDIVLNYDIPHVKQDFIHRVGRTGRAGREGMAITLVSLDEIEQLKDLYKLLGEKIKEIIVPEYCPKEVKARGYLLHTPQKARHKKSNSKKPTSILNKKGKKRKVTKRDGFKILDARNRAKAKK